MFRNLLMRLGLFFQQYTIGQRLVVFFIPIMMISTLLVLLLWANKPSYEVLFSDIDANSAGEIVESLRSEGTKYKIENQGRTILVESAKVGELRLRYNKISGGNGNSGYGVFDKTNIGMTQFMQKVSMKIALEGELTRTLEEYSEIKSARVQLVIDEGDLFSKGDNGSASVSLQLNPGYYLSPDQVNGIAVTISNAVDGIDLNDVSIVDTRGGILFEGSNDGGSESGSDFWSTRRNIADEKEIKVRKMLDKIVGMNNSTVSVAVDINFEQIERTSEIFDSEDVAIISEEQLVESGTRPDSSSFSNQNSVTNYELSKTTEHFTSQPEIKRITVAVNVDGIYQTNEDGIKNYLARPTSEMNNIVSLVRQAVGYNETRGDEVIVTNIQFDRSRIEEDKIVMASMQKSALIETWAERGILLLIVGIMVFFVMKIMRSVIGDAQLILPMGNKKVVAIGTAGGGTITGKLGRPKTEEEEVDVDEFMQKLSPDARAKLEAKDQMSNDISEFVKQAPEDAANLVRSWIANSSMEEGKNAKE